MAARPNQIESATRDACYRLERRADEIGIGIDEQVDRFLRDYRTVGFAEAVMLNS